MDKTIDLSHALSATISVRNHQTSDASFVSSFVTGDTIAGEVSLTPHCDVRFEDVQISFIGEQRTSVRSGIPGQAYRQFLSTMQPIERSALPDPLVFKKGHQYHFPFSFQVMDHLPVSSCRHPTTSRLVKAAHLQPPPSFGDATVSGFGGKLLDDFAPPNCKIVYAVQVKIIRTALVTGKRETILVKKSKVRVKPALDQCPPLNPDDFGGEYRLQHECLIEDHGHLTMTLEQPKSFWLPLRDPHSSISQAVRILLQYKPTDSVNPTLPKLKSLRGQITGTTVYTTTFHEDLPSKKKDFFGQPENYCETEFPSFGLLIPEPQWMQDGEGGYMATLMVPVTLPRQNFVPSFHSCLVSRMYTLQFRLAIQATAPVWLKAPIQIAAQRDASVLPSYSASVGFLD